MSILPSKHNGKVWDPTNWWPPCSELENYNYLSGRLRARLGGLFDESQLAALFASSPLEYETALLESSYGPQLRASALNDLQWKDDQFMEGLYLEASNRVDRLIHLAKGEVAYVALICSLLSDLPAGVAYLNGSFTKGSWPNSLIFGPQNRSWWSELLDQGENDVDLWLGDQNRPIADLLAEGRVLRETESLSEGEAHFVSGAIKEGRRWATEVRNAQFVKELLDDLTDQWNFRFWRHGGRHKKRLDFIVPTGFIERGQLQTAQNEERLFAGTKWKFSREQEDRDTALEMERQYLSELGKSNRLDPIESGLFVAFVARQVRETNRLADRLWLYRFSEVGR